MSENQKFCPLFFIGDCRYRRCIGDACAWFREDVHSCAISALAFEAGGISSALDGASGEIATSADRVARKLY